MKIKELKQLSGKQFKRTLLNAEGIEDIPQIKAFAGREATKVNTILQEDKNSFYFVDPKDKDNTFRFIKPKRNKEVLGELIFRSKDYYFEDPLNGRAYGDLPKAKDIFENGFTLIGFEGQSLLKYELVKEGE